MRLTAWRRVAAAAVLLFCLPGAAARAENPSRGGTSPTGTLDGKLTDWHSAPLIRAAVVARNLTTGVALKGVTGKNGSYHFAGLGPGEYRLEADVPGLGKGAVEGILVSAGHATRVQAALVLEAQRRLPIEAELHALDPVAPAVSTTIPSEELNQLPVAARDWEQFAAITPAANPLPAGGQGAGGGQLGESGGEAASEPEGASLSLEGAGGFETSGSIDGLPAAPAFRSSGTRQSRATESVGASAVATMQARTGAAPADAGRIPGGSLDLVTFHGQNGLHGQAFYLNRESLWGAQNPFTQWIQQTAPANGIYIAQFTPAPYSPANSRQTFGFGVGRELRRDKLFWFAALDGLIESDPAVATVRHPADFFAEPTEAQLTVLAALLNLPSTDPWDEGAAAYSAGLGELAGLLGPVPRSAREFQGFGRVDWQATEREHLSVEAQSSSEDAPSGAATRSSETYGSHSFGNRQASFAWAQARWDLFFTSNLLGTVAAQWGRTVESETAQAPSAFEAPLIANPWGQLPEIVADSRYGFVLGKPAGIGWSGRDGLSSSGTRNPDEQALRAQGTLSWVRGAHLVKAGASLDHIADAVNGLVNQTGTYSYADVLNFLTDASSFLAHGFPGVGNGSLDQSNCDSNAKIHQFQNGQYSGIGPYPCYAWYTQRIGPANWRLSTNDVAGFATEQWQPFHTLTLSAGARVESEQLPPPIGLVRNANLPATERLPGTTLNWGPRVGLAWSPRKTTVLRAGAGLYFGRIDNSAILAALTQTGSTNGDLNFFFKPTDTGAPPFPYVFPVEPRTAVTPGAVWFAPRFRAQEVDQAVVSVEQELPSHWLVSASGLASLGRRLPISIDTNLNTGQSPRECKHPCPRPIGGTETGEVFQPKKPQPTITYDVVDPLGAGPIKTPTITVPFYAERVNPSYQQLSSIESRANSTYEAALVKIARYGGRGLSLRGHYLYAHAADWNPNESGNVAGNNVLDPEDFRLEYGRSNLDIRHSAAATVLYATPWKRRDWAGALANGWSVAAVGQFRSGLPFTMRTGGYIPGYYEPLEAGGSVLVQGVATGMNGSGGDNRIYGIGRNTYRYPATWTGDARLAKRFQFAHQRELELLAESFNLLNHQNVTRIETTGYTIDRGSTDGSNPTFNFMTGLTRSGSPSATTVEFGKPLDVNATNFYRPREFQFGLRARF